MPDLQNPYPTNMMTAQPMGQGSAMDWSSEVRRGGQTVPQPRMGQGMPMQNMPMQSMPMQNMQGQSRGAMSRPSAWSGKSGVNLQNNLSEDVIDAPMASSEAYLGSLKSALYRNKGNYVVATFLIGTQGSVSWEGILHEVGHDYIVLYQAGRDRYIVGDMYSLKFIEFYDMRQQLMCDAFMRQNNFENPDSSL